MFRKSIPTINAVLCLAVLIGAGSTLLLRHTLARLEADDLIDQTIRASDREFQEIVSKSEVNELNSGGNTAAMMAAYGARHKKLEALMRAGADLNPLNTVHENALMMAAAYMRGISLSDVIAHTKNIDEVDRYGQTALAWAIFFHNRKGADDLIHSGANPYHRDRFGITPYDLAVFRGMDEEVAAMVKAHGIPPFETYAGMPRETPILWSDPVLDALSERGASLEERDPIYGETALATATRLGAVDAVRRLIRRHVDLEAENKFGLTPLLVAARARNLILVKVLLSAGANCRARDHFGETARSYLSHTSGGTEVLRRCRG